MIKRIDIPKFGSFSNFIWTTALRDGTTIHDCKRLNIIYGRNYSGKTTLSRILRSYEVGRLPDNFSGPQFSLTTDDGTISQNDIYAHNQDIRVYNTDFIDENLSFLADHAGGEVKTFAIIGRENKEIERKIHAKETTLGSVETKSGLRYELAEMRMVVASKNRSAATAKQALEESLRRHANDVIKRDRTFGDPSYNINSIKRDIQAVTTGSFQILDEDEIRSRQDLLREQVLQDIQLKVRFQPAFSSILDDAKHALEKSIRPSTAIQELLHDTVLQSWVRTGIEYHRDTRSSCGFCGQPLPRDLWEKLDAHFNKESSELEEELTRQIAVVQQEIAATSRIGLPAKDCFYVSHRASYESRQLDLEHILTTYQTKLAKILKQLEARRASIFQKLAFTGIENVSGDLLSTIETFNTLIEDNNATTATLPKKQSDARECLRKNEVATFLRDINFEAEQKKVVDLTTEAQSTSTELNKFSDSVRMMDEEIEELRTQLQNEKMAAEKVNGYLNHYFGHGSLRLEAAEDPIESKFTFQVMRGGEPAYNMSEGERSLVAFCYFIARLEDVETKGKDLIIYIDDPISSLDSNHIFFVYSLIDSVIAKPVKNAAGVRRYQYKQLFVSTHNLDFFKYLIRLSRPDKQHGTQFFLVEREGGESTIRLMPKYLRDYQTEFHYLFHQIFRCKNGQGAHENHEVFYNFGNNLRKFLEAFLFYKYPYKDDKDSASERLLKFFGDDATATALTNRVGNELSHLERIFDRSMRPIEIPEIPAVANFVLDKMYENDKEQFNALLQSIGEPARAD